MRIKSEGIINKKDIDRVIGKRQVFVVGGLRDEK